MKLNKAILVILLMLASAIIGYLAANDFKLGEEDEDDIVEDDKPFKEIYDPFHTDADENGMVKMPNVDTVEQMVDLMSARRDYEANVAALDAVKSMAMRALDIGR